MAIQREFIGWNGPCLHSAARWLKDRYHSDRVWNLSGVLIVVPGRRSGRRLLEVLVDHAQGHVLIPPQITTTGELPELLYEPDVPIADPLTAMLARVSSLQQADPDLIRDVWLHRPDHGDLLAYVALARDLADLDNDLAAGGVPIDQVVSRCRACPDFTDDRRWEALAKLRQHYEQTLRQHRLQDRHTARFHAVNSQRCLAKTDIVLLATAGLHKLTGMMLRQVSERVTTLIHAPRSYADDFDELGSLVVERWSDRKLDLDPAAIRFVDNPADQASEVLRVIGSIANDRYSADQITIGLGDESTGSVIERALGLAGVPARLAAGRSVLHSRPAMLLEAFAQYLDSQRFDDFAALVRHPDLQTYLDHKLHLTNQIPTSGPDRVVHCVSWLTLLDQYATDHLPQNWPIQKTDHPQMRSQFQPMHDLVTALLGDPYDDPQPLPHWSRVIADALIAVYGHLELNRHSGQDADLTCALETIGKVLADQEKLEPNDELTPTVSVQEAIRLTLARLSNQHTPPEGGTPAVELMGPLELQLDDAPVLIITTVNEGYIPRCANADVLLPNHTRQALGLEDNRHRYARDMMMCHAVTHSRDHVTFIAGRRTDDDQPLAPSRLLLACDQNRISQTVQRFYAQTGAHDRQDKTPLIGAHGPDSRLIVPPPHPLSQPITELPVTAFRDYLACPYRFYLKHVLRLRKRDDHAVEMDGRVFGQLAHQVLERFGRSHLTGSTHTAAIKDYLHAQLEAIARRQFGRARSAAVTIQCQQLRDRLSAFADWQARRAQQGWRIVPEHTEKELRATIDVDAEPFVITGRIDRIDVHHQWGHSILDYKTRDTATSPEKTHRRGPKEHREWVDLQLPLYRKLVQTIGVTGPTQLGYIQLPKDQPMLAPADWQDHELASAYRLLEKIIRTIRAETFWPPVDRPRYADEFSSLCLDDCPDRASVLARSTAAMDHWSGGRPAKPASQTR